MKLAQGFQKQLKSFKDQCWDPIKGVDIPEADFLQISQVAQEITAQFVYAVDPVEIRFDNDVETNTEMGKAKPCTYVRGLCCQMCYFQC